MWHVLLVTLISPTYALTKECNMPVDLGKKNCKSSSQIRYFFDAKTHNCLPFSYTGCGGNANNFDTAQRCYVTCMTPDQLTLSCAVNAKPKGTCDNRGWCPKETVCLFDGKTGICCDEKNEQKFYSDLNPDCGKKHVVYELHGSKVFPVLGKNCSHNFCPKESECHHGNFFAYCCRNVFRSGSYDFWKRE